MKTGLHAKLKWLTREKISPLPQTVPAILPETRPGWFSPQTAEHLLATPLRQQLLKIIWQRTSLSGALFAELYQAPVSRFAERVQLLPASEYHHHSHPGGLLDHTLEVMAFAAKLRQRHLLPAGAAPEDQAREAEAWTAGIIYAALLHDVGKIATDIEVSTDDNQPWYPWQLPLNRPYRLKYHKKRDHRLHPVAGSLLAAQILPVTALNWLAQYRELYTSFLYCISGHYDQAGIMGELVQEADRASVAQFMGANASTALERPQPSLPKQILTALRELVQSEFKLSNANSGSDGWLTDDALWLISKTTADRIRAWLLQQGVTGVPDSNVRLFDEMQSYGLIIPTPEGKAIWACTISADSGWSPGCPLTLLRLSPSRIWNTPEERPAPFAGQIVPAAASTDAPAIVPEAENTSPAVAPTAPESGPMDDLADLTLSLFAPQDTKMADTGDTANIQLPEEIALAPDAPFRVLPPSPLSPSTPPIEHITASVNPGVQTETVNTDKPLPVPDTDFITWLKNGIQARKIIVNDTMARVHMVEGKVFLVSPEIFKLYIKSTTGSTGDEWKLAQKAFQKLKLHQRGPDGVNIFNCEVRGPRKTRRVRGYLLEQPEIIFGNSVPEDNPYLSIVTQ
ncbi:helicase/relaxase domain-containing protein [Salmonella enterica]|nr:helicase/relaxase domain-containing protein [Salmonella enterica]EJH7441376.1 helicase/relaxase domain-containing protein [Salmonella enterica]EJH7880799.1 helicase/relaxase domain-containing protein [Salmonella enterica]EJI6713492.1 helicase/relaxase domain-containing protein [Salmonella enterica]